MLLLLFQEFKGNSCSTVLQSKLLKDKNTESTFQVFEQLNCQMNEKNIWFLSHFVHIAIPPNSDTFFDGGQVSGVVGQNLLTP